MPVIPKTTPAVTTAPAPARPQPAAINMTAFLTTQASWLRRALLHSDEVTIGVVVGSHNLSHDRWLSLITYARSALSIEAAAEVMSLYELHGRLVEGLEHDTMLMLDPVVAAAARILLAENLDEKTEAVIAALSEAPSR